MKRAVLQDIVNNFMQAVPAVITSARSHNGGTCMVCGSPRGRQHDDTCAFWSLIDARISYRVAAEGPKTPDADKNRTEVMQLLEGGSPAISPSAPELEFAPNATASDEWWLA